MLSVDEATRRIAAGFSPLNEELADIAHAAGRVLADDTVAPFDQPPAPVSAMDGYALRSADAAAVPAAFTVIGTAPAGAPFDGAVGPGEVVRVFTGGVVPDGADCVVIQEDTEPDGDHVRVLEAPRPGQHVRARGLDFSAGDRLLPRGHRLCPRDIALLAAADFAQVPVMRAPRVAVVATGDELARPGEPRKAGGVIASSTYALCAMVERWGGVAEDIGILPDRLDAYAAIPNVAKDADLVLTQGGASVGDHDLIKAGLAPHGFVLDFWKIAMRPGKPLIFGRLGKTPLIGLPGNPVSAMVCAILFVHPAIEAMLGREYAPPTITARLSAPLKANGKRQDYIRTRIITRPDGMIAEPFALQDSAMQKIFAEADGLIIRPVGAPPAKAGASVEVLLLES